MPHNVVRGVTVQVWSLNQKAMGPPDMQLSAFQEDFQVNDATI